MGFHGLDWMKDNDLLCMLAACKVSLGSADMTYDIHT